MLDPKDLAIGPYAESADSRSSPHTSFLEGILHVIESLDVVGASLKTIIIREIRYRSLLSNVKFLRVRANYGS